MGRTQRTWTYLATTRPYPKARIWWANQSHRIRSVCYRLKCCIGASFSKTRSTGRSSRKKRYKIHKCSLWYNHRSQRLLIWHNDRRKWQLSGVCWGDFIDDSFSICSLSVRKDCVRLLSFDTPCPEPEISLQSYASRLCHIPSRHNLGTRRGYLSRVIL